VWRDMPKIVYSKTWSESTSTGFMYTQAAEWFYFASSGLIKDEQ